jgi:hypothetical protein
MEKEDILNQYKSVCQENERITEDIKAIATENKELFAKVQFFERELSGVHLRLQTTDSKE